MIESDKQSKYYGCILGQAIGDALGFPVEGANHESCELYVSRLRINQEMPCRSPFKPGQYTDDTQLARELMITLSNHSEFNVDVFASRFANLFETNQIVGKGIASQNAAYRIMSGISWKESGEPRPSAGNGTAMRSAPVGLKYSNVEKIKEISVLHSIISHKDPRTHAGSIIIALAVRYLLDHPKLEIDGFLKFCSEPIRTLSPIFYKELRQLPEYLDISETEVVTMIAKSGNPDFQDGWDLISPYVIPSVIWSLYSFLRYPDNFAKAVKLAIWAGGDVDTTAAMTGALSGTHVGIDNIHSKWIDQINDQGKWKAKELKLLVDDIIS